MYYFCGVSHGEENNQFWDEIYEYINGHYDLEKVKKIYLNADGRGWIKSVMKRLEECLADDTGLKRVADAKDYILLNWTAARLRLTHRDGVKGSSTEGHVSHVLSSRMSS